MIWCDREPTLEDILSDPIVRVVMDADGVDPRRLELESTPREMALGLRAARRADSRRPTG
jgi:hypothetical protein